MSVEVAGVTGKGTAPDQKIHVAPEPVEITSTRRALHVKRIIDVAAAATLLVLLSPVLLGAAVAVVVTSGRPILFRQARLGFGGKEFEVLKFRTMRPGTHDDVMADPEARRAYVANGWKLDPDDHRITRVGRYLRRSSVDELPQLVNVLVGDMSLVGVRPLLADELAERPPRDRSLYVTMRPGMTGRWQVMGRSALDEVDRIGLDREYLEHWSLVGDLRLLVRTPAALLKVTHAH